MRRAAPLAVAALLAALPAVGCGHCVEDRVAAVYDASVIAKAQARQHRMAYFAIAGTLPARGSRQVMAVALAPARGVDLHSMRLSVDSAALSLSYDGKRTSTDRIRDTLNRGLAARGLSVSPLQRPEEK